MNQYHNTTQESENLDLFQPLSDINKARTDWQKDIWIKPGVVCPVCDRMGKVYARRFGLPMAKSLIWLYRVSKVGEWIHLPTTGNRYVLRTNQWGHLVKFGVVDAMPVDDDAKTNSSGYYKITEYGARVVERTAMIPMYIFTYNNERIESDGEVDNIYISDVFTGKDKGFSFDEIMAAAAGLIE